MPDIINYTFFYFISLVFLSIKYWKSSNPLLHLISLVILVSTYAIIKTNGITFLWLSLISSISILILEKNSLCKPKFNWLILPFGLISYALFFLLNFDFNILALKVPFMDYLYYGIISKYLNIIGKENTQTFFNLINPSLTPTIDFYHYFELWMAAMYMDLGLNPIYVLQLIVFPLFLSITSFSIAIYTSKNYTAPSFNKWLFTIPLLLFFGHGLLEIWHNYFFPSPISNHIIYNMPKLLLILPLVVYLLSKKPKGFKFFLFTWFLASLYATILIPLLAAQLLFLGIGVLFFKWDLKANRSILLGILAVSIFCILIIKSGAIHPSSPLMFIPKIKQIIFAFIKLIGLILSYFIFTYYYFKDLEKNTQLMLSCMGFSGLFLWLIQYNLANADQFFYYTIFSILLVTSVFSLVKNSSISYWKFIFFLFPTLQISTQIPSNGNPELKKLAMELNQKEMSKILVIDNEENLTSFYKYKSSFWHPLAELNAYNINLHLMNVNSFFPPLKNIAKADSLMIHSWNREDIKYLGEINYKNPLDLKMSFQPDTILNISSVNMFLK